MAKHYAKRRVPFFDLQWEMEHGSYVMDPQYATGSFKEPHYCAIYYQALREGFGNQATPCTIKCDLCRNVCETTDYMRGKSAPHYPVPCVYYGKDNPQFWAFRRKFEARYRKGVRQ